MATSSTVIYPRFTDFEFASLGVPRNRHLPANQDASYFDLGLCGPMRHDMQDRPEYCGKFRAPTLRNAALRHSASAPPRDLWQLVKILGIEEIQVAWLASHIDVGCYGPEVAQPAVRPLQPVRIGDRFKAGADRVRVQRPQ